MLTSVDRELERGVERFRRPPPPRSLFDIGSGPPPEPAPHRDRHGPHPDGSDDNHFHPHEYKKDGSSLIPQDMRPPWDADAVPRALRGESVLRTVTMDDEPIRVLTVPSFDYLGERGAVQNAYGLKEVYRAIAGIDTALLLLLPVGLLASGWVGAALTNRVLKRVHRMTQAAGRISANDLTARLPVTGDDEFSELAETFNGMLGRLNGAFEEQKRVLERLRRFTADASHELKTPLTIIKGETSLALSRAEGVAATRDALCEIDAAANTMSALVQDLLLLARSDGGQMGRNRIEMLVQEVLADAIRQTPKHQERNIVVDIAPEELSIVGNEGELARLFRNLLDNAVRYTRPRATITLTARAVAGRVRILVADTGIGIAPEHLPHLGERFYRVDESRTRPTGGTGLGLSICKSIAEAHGGTLTFASEVGKGTLVTVTLPLPAA
jgi:signal transduction histidine kinase